ncbi:hypothetical protein ABEB36_009214 [Hypothenemus hampei]|uniref:Uncharacterized protein n=2 Tax=Hypothenemus hampei TaxID=57062 RepID=A0ABD1EPJ1_HYPHA
MYMEFCWNASGGGWGLQVYENISVSVHLYVPKFVWFFIQHKVINIIIMTAPTTTVNGLKTNQFSLWANTAKANSKNTGVSLNSPKEILGAKVVSGKFGTQVLLELEKSVVFLPKRTTTVLEPHIDELKGNYIIFEGIRKFNNHEQVYFNFLHPWETSELEKGNVH